jgi:predicted RecB family nuclease
MQVIYDYNEDDCRATRHVLEELKKFWEINDFYC